MLLFEFPLDTHSHDIRETLDGLQYQLDFQYMERVGSWYCHISDAEGNRLFSGLRLSNQYNVLRNYQQKFGSPLGSLAVLLIEGDQSLEMDDENFGATHQLAYIDLTDREFFAPFEPASTEFPVEIT